MGFWQVPSELSSKRLALKVDTYLHTTTHQLFLKALTPRNRCTTRTIHGDAQPSLGNPGVRYVVVVEVPSLPCKEGLVTYARKPRNITCIVHEIIVGRSPERCAHLHYLCASAYHLLLLAWHPITSQQTNKQSSQTMGDLVFPSVRVLHFECLLCFCFHMSCFAVLCM